MVKHLDGFAVLLLSAWGSLIIITIFILVDMISFYKQ
jgi:hypothetical protein